MHRCSSCKFFPVLYSNMLHSSAPAAVSSSSSSSSPASAALMGLGGHHPLSLLTGSTKPSPSDLHHHRPPPLEDTKPPVRHDSHPSPMMEDRVCTTVGMVKIEIYILTHQSHKPMKSARLQNFTR